MNTIQIQNQMTHSRLLTFLFALALIFLFNSCGEIFHEKTEAELKQELAEKEKQNAPSNYLLVDSAQISEDYTNVKIESNLFSPDKYERRHNYYYVVGVIKNRSLETKYKDVKLLIVYNSTTGSEMQNEEVTVYDFFEPNSTKSFRIKVNPSSEWYEQSGSNSSIVVKDATPVEGNLNQQ